MATVYLAIQESLDRHVALKVLSPHLSGEHTFNDRFLREARIAARFLHRSIVQIHDINAHDGRPFIAMEYLPGGTLGARMPEMGLTDKLVVIAEIADALDFMHRQSVIHRDVKPDNIIFRADNSPVITDFGIARAANSVTRMTVTGSILGTPHYMSPEQARGKKIEPRSDLYSLGVVLFKMLAGHVPYDAEDQFSICAMHVNEPIPRLPDELSHLQDVVDRLLAKDPDDRFQTGEALHQQLEEAAGMALLSRRPTEMATEETIVESPEENRTRFKTGGAWARRRDDLGGESSDSAGPEGAAEPEVPTRGPTASYETAVQSPGTGERADSTGNRVEIDPHSSERPLEQASIPPQPYFGPRWVRAVYRPIGRFVLRHLALLRIRLSVFRQSLRREGFKQALHAAWLGPSGVLTRGNFVKKNLVQPVVWVPAVAGIVLVSGLVWTMINQQGTVPASDPEAVLEGLSPQGRDIAAGEIPSTTRVALGPTLRQIGLYCTFGGSGNALSI